MWPPIPSKCLFARDTMTAAFQRIRRRIRRSRSSSPGNSGSCPGGIVLMYGVETMEGTPICRACASRVSW